MEPVKHPKGWGYELWIANNEKYCGKILHFNKGKRCSYHYHKLKKETFYVESGKVELRYGDKFSSKKLVLHPGDSFEVPTGLIHQIFAMQESKIFEFSTTHYESDSYRIELGD
jgi:mannose-6-phosphate isomerase-like protein (cupin superfamily)